MTLPNSLRGGLIVSVQAWADSVLNTPEAIALLARCAVQNGAVALRVEGLERIRAVRAAVAVPIIGIIKRATPGFEPYITATAADVDAVAGAGAVIVAFDATQRPHPGETTVGGLIEACQRAGVVAMADCAEPGDARVAAAAGAPIVASTLAGYTDSTRGRSLPALDMIRTMANLGCFTIAEGGIGTPMDARMAFAAGADAIVVGTAITNVDALVRNFIAATPLAR